MREESSSETRPGAVRAPAIRGSIWTLGGYAFSQLFRLGSSIILARLLFPAVFGEVALVYTVTTALQLFSDVGIGPAIIQHPRGETPRFLNTAWTLGVIRGVMIWIGSWAVAFPVAWFYDQPNLRWLIPVAALGAISNGFEAPAIFLARRHIQLERLTVMEVLSQVLGSIATIALALGLRWAWGPQDHRAVWAVVIGGLVGWAVRLAFTHLAMPGPTPSFDFDRESLRSLFHFGRWIFLATVLTFLAGPADRLIFGKLIPLALLGVYGIAANLAMLPTEAVSRLGSAVVFPALSRVAERGDFRQLFHRIRLPLVVGGAMLATGVIAAGPFLVRILYDSRYADAGWILQYLGAMSWFQILESVNGAALLAKGRSDWTAAGNASKLVGMCLFIPLGFYLRGFPGALGGIVLSEGLRYASSALGLSRLGIPVAGRDIVFSLGISAVAVIGFWSGTRVGDHFHSAIAGFLVAGSISTLTWGLLGLRYWQPGFIRRAASG